MSHMCCTDSLVYFLRNGFWVVLDIENFSNSNGAPSLLHSNNSQHISSMNWTCKLRHPQNQGSIERSNCDVEDILTAWSADDNSTDWTIGLKVWQFQTNSSHHSEIPRTQFAALLGPYYSGLSQEVLAKLQTKNDLLQVLSPETQPQTTVNFSVVHLNKIKLKTMI